VQQILELFMLKQLVHIYTFSGPLWFLDTRMDYAPSARKEQRLGLRVTSSATDSVITVWFE
jgi:hypothetical protein